MSSRPISQEMPIVETERLILRGHRLDDFENCLALWADPVVTRYIGGRPFSAEEVWTRLLRYVGHWTLLGFGFWAIEDKAAGSFVGELGFAESIRKTIRLCASPKNAAIARRGGPSTKGSR